MGGRLPETCRVVLSKYIWNLYLLVLFKRNLLRCTVIWTSKNCTTITIIIITIRIISITPCGLVGGLTLLRYDRIHLVGFIIQTTWMFHYCRCAAPNLNAYLQTLNNNADIWTATFGISSVTPFFRWARIYLSLFSELII